jgi:hypothetical protein
MAGFMRLFFATNVLQELKKSTDIQGGTVF